MNREAAGIALLFAPHAGDSQALRTLMPSLGLDVHGCADPREFYEGLAGDPMLAVVTEEGLLQCRTEDLAAVLSRQPAWSDLPLLALAGGSGAQVDNGRFEVLAGLGNFTLVERPTSRQVLLMAMRAAIRARRLQYAVRDHWRELQSHAEQLEAAVAERTRQLELETRERSRVEAALEEARRLESLGRLTGGVAHDFNNLLQVISGSETLLRVLHGAQLDPKVARALDGIHRATERGASLTQRLLAYARRQPLSNKTLDLLTHLGATADLMLNSLGEDIDLRLHLPAHLWPIEADPSQLDAAVLNIVSNARDAMPGGGCLVIAARNVSLPDPALPEGKQLAGDFVCLTLTDNGTGMSEEIAQQAFDPFYTTKGVGMGTGLGLSQVYGFASQSRGLAFIRREHPGTTIGMLLPRGSAAGPSAAGPAEGRVGDLTGIHMLYVEDDAAVAESTLALLQGLGASVVSADSADAAIALDLAQFDLVLSDVMMPGSMDGVELARWIAEQHPALPVVLCSGYMLDPQRLQSLSVQFVRKPYRMSELVDAVRRALERAAPLAPM